MTVLQFILVPTWRECGLFAVLGACLFANQLLYILGVFYTTPDVASIWQVRHWTG